MPSRVTSVFVHDSDRRSRLWWLLSLPDAGDWNRAYHCKAVSEVPPEPVEGPVEGSPFGDSKSNRRRSVSQVLPRIHSPGAKRLSSNHKLKESDHTPHPCSIEGHPIFGQTPKASKTFMV